MIFWTLIVFWSTCDLLLWWRGDRAVRRLRFSLLWRPAIALFFLAMISVIVNQLSQLVIGYEPDVLPTIITSAAYLWHFLILPATVCVAATFALIFLIRRSRKSKPQPLAADRPSATGLPSAAILPDSVEADSPTHFSRREAFQRFAVLLPPITTSGLLIPATLERTRLRVRRFEVDVPTLPDDLDGLTIAHVTDLHAGQFCGPEMITLAAETVNALKTDLVVFTGDLVDRGLLSRLPMGLEFLAQLDWRQGFAMIEGNHDVQGDAVEFESQIEEHMLPLLLNDQITYEVQVAGKKKTRVQLLGIDWGELESKTDVRDDGTTVIRFLRDSTEESRRSSVEKVAALRDPSAFPILLAHHPHTFDPAAEAGFPLVLSGHTHGGQIMLTSQIGAGPLRFRYWSGVYEKPNSRLVIANGIGSWFPLRINAPAEILHLTLRPAKPEM